MREWKKEQDAISYSVANAEQPTHTNENGKRQKKNEATEIRNMRATENKQK